MIRPANVADIWALRRKAQRRIYFYNDALLASSYHSYILSLRSIIDPMSSDRQTLVLRDHGVRGYLQTCRRSHTAATDLQFLGSFNRRARSRLSDGDVFFQLLEEYLKRAGNDQIERVFATLGARSADVIEVLRQLGFHPYAQQSVWMLSEPIIEAGSSMVALRRQARRDAWGIQQLYTSLTPRHVQQAEPRESTSWILSRRQQWFRGAERCWVLGDDQSLTVHIHLRTGSRGHVLRIMVAPHLRADTTAMVRYVLSQLHDQRPVFAVLRGYQSELRASFEELGFVERGEQTSFVKHLAILKRQPAFLPTLLGKAPGEGALPVSIITNYNGTWRQHERTDCY
ncbi:MAG TPA: hypothetical protein VEZ12_04285 [Herpetosiphonaceae bacterium]|nr:hypothetical protein [Herpetosiphonaceae bacterium]